MLFLRLRIVKIKCLTLQIVCFFLWRALLILCVEAEICNLAVGCFHMRCIFHLPQENLSVSWTYWIAQDDDNSSNKSLQIIDMYNSSTVSEQQVFAASKFTSTIRLWKWTPLSNGALPSCRDCMVADSHPNNGRQHCPIVIAQGTAERK